MLGLNFKFVWNIVGASIISLQVGVPDVVMDTIILGGLVESVDHVFHNGFLFDFFEMLLDLFTERSSVLLLTPLFLDFLLVVRMASLLVFCQCLNRFAI